MIIKKTTDKGTVTAVSAYAPQQGPYNDENDRFQAYK